MVNTMSGTQMKPKSPAGGWPLEKEGQMTRHMCLVMVPTVVINIQVQDRRAGKDRTREERLERGSDLQKTHQCFHPFKVSI